MTGTGRMCPKRCRSVTGEQMAKHILGRRRDDAGTRKNTPQAVPVVCREADGSAKRGATMTPEPSRKGDALVDSHPLASVAGSFRSDPLWDEFQDAVRDYRRSIDEVP